MKPTVEQGFQRLATQYLRKHTKQLVEQLSGIREGDDIEYVHRARVACRRLRAGLRMARHGLDPQRYATWRKQIRRLAKRLGDARDKDVQIDFLCGVLCENRDKDVVPGIARMMVGVQRRREQIHPAVVSAVDRFRESGVAEDLLEAMKAALVSPETEHEPAGSPEVFDQTKAHILKRLEAFLSHEESLADPLAQDRHHEMRIDAKRFRYTLEVCRAAYQGRLDGYLGTIKRIQTLLGDIHDCDVWIDHLPVMLEEERAEIRRLVRVDGPLAQLEAGVEFLRLQRRKSRQRFFNELVDLWKELEEKEYWQGLAALVRSSADPKAEQGDDADQALGADQALALGAGLPTPPKTPTAGLPTPPKTPTGGLPSGDSHGHWETIGPPSAGSGDPRRATIGPPSAGSSDPRRTASDHASGP